MKYNKNSRVNKIEMICNDLNIKIKIVRDLTYYYNLYYLKTTLKNIDKVYDTINSIISLYDHDKYYHGQKFEFILNYTQEEVFSITQRKAEETIFYVSIPLSFVSNPNKSCIDLTEKPSKASLYYLDEFLQKTYYNKLQDKIKFLTEEET